MKCLRFISILALFSLLACGRLASRHPASQLASSGASAIPIVAPDVEYEIVLLRAEIPVLALLPASTDTERCDHLRAVLLEAKSGDTLKLGRGRFDCAGKEKGTVFFPTGISVVGKGKDVTHLYSNVLSDAQGSAFEIRNGSFADLAFENISWEVFEDGRTIEFYTGMKRTADNIYYERDVNNQKIVVEANLGPYTAAFDRVKFIGTAWVIYDWSARGHRWILRDSLIESGRQGISLMGSGGFGQNAEILRTTIDIDTRRSADIGATSNATYGGGYGLVVRGGNAIVTDSVFRMRCGETGHRSSHVPRCVGVYDGNNFGGTASSSNVRITLTNPTFSINGNGSTDTFDLLMTQQSVIDNLVLIGGTGSGSNGVITTNWLPR